jgi:hypothetical protein
MRAMCRRKAPATLFFDWKPDAQTKAPFEKYGVPYAADMKAFFDVIFYPGK